MDVNGRLFVLLNASDHPPPVLVELASLLAADVVFAALLVLVGLWAWGNTAKRGGVIATVAGTLVALGVNQLLGMLWYEPRPFMVRIGHTLAAHAPENSFPSNHATFMFSIGLGLVATGVSRMAGALVCVAGLAVAWARIYLGLHFPVDMLGSALVAAVCALGAAAFEHPLARHVVPLGNRLYDGLLDLLRLPRNFFPRTPEAK